MGTQRMESDFQGKRDAVLKALAKLIEVLRESTDEGDVLYCKLEVQKVVEPPKKGGA